MNCKTHMTLYGVDRVRSIYATQYILNVDTKIVR